ncbi:hypothetical protein MA16_Dca022641 [Dendrobium catenatum]|uniref:Uncharacterized protein n=1 Tax=Dendrobium catenatum TaxID=906689 RepID=A0A2I0VC22_9ASPA|nr:hypothetical protein MA16_Dca022641 [Dendrobium catenatum]
MKRRKKLLLDHRRSFAGQPPEAHAFPGPSLKALTSVKPPSDVVALLDHHLRPSPSPDYRLTRCSAGQPLEALTSAGPPPDVVALPNHHLRPLTFAGPPPDVVALPHHHLRPSPPSNPHLRPCATPRHHLRPRLLLGHHLMPSSTIVLPFYYGLSDPGLLPTTILLTSVTYYGPSDLHEQTTVFLTTVSC